MTNSSGGTSITSLSPGSIYKIANIDFDASKMSTIPNASDVTITAKVTIQSWEVVNVDASI